MFLFLCLLYVKDDILLTSTCLGGEKDGRSEGGKREKKEKEGRGGRREVSCREELAVQEPHTRLLAAHSLLLSKLRKLVYCCELRTVWPVCWPLYWPHWEIHTWQGGGGRLAQRKKAMYKNFFW